jgi:hemerythrin-like domain-containing protein
MKATDVLIAEHKQILRALNVLEEMGVWVEHGRTLEPGDVDDILRILRLFAEDHHQGKEELVLFPAMLRLSEGGQRASIQHMIFEHNQERALVKGMEDALRRSKGEEFIRHVNWLVSTLRTHIYKEDHILFVVADELLGSDENELVVARLNEFNAGWKERVLDGLFERLHALEWKYLRRAA